MNRTKLKMDKKRKLNYFLVLSLVAVSGFPFFTASKIPLIFSFIIAVFIFFLKGKKVNKFYYQTIIFLAVLVVAQTIDFNYFSFNSNVGLLIRWTYPFLVVIIVGNRFPDYYVSIIYFFAIISFFLFIPTILFPNFYSLLKNVLAPIFNQSIQNDYSFYSPNIVFYTVRDYSSTGFFVHRNSGPFWEPGAFSGYTIIAMVFNTILSGSLINKKNIVFLGAIFSTLSAAGFLALVVFIFLYFLRIQKDRRAWLFFPIIIAVFIYMFKDINIINTKLTNSVEQYKYGDINKKRSRVISALLDFKDIIEYPFYGKGRSMATRFGESKKSWVTHRNNGDTDFAVKYGIPFWLFYFYFIYYSFKKYSIYYDRDKFFPLIAITIILIIGFAETYFQQSFFISLFYLHLVYKKKENKIIENKKKVLIV